MPFSKKPQDAEDAPDSSAEAPLFLDFDGPGKTTKAERIGRWLVLVIALALGAWLTWAMAASFVPRWWAQHVGDRVDGSFTAGVGWGFGYGFFATALSLLVVIQARRKFLSWWGKLLVILLAVAISAPNLMTLAVTIGNGKAAHAGRRIFDVTAPGFQWASLMGVISAAVLVLLLLFVLWRSRRNKREIADLRHQVDENKKSQTSESDAAPDTENS